MAEVGLEVNKMSVGRSGQELTRARANIASTLKVMEKSRQEECAVD